MNRRNFFFNLASLAGIMTLSSLGGRALAERKRGGAAPAAGTTGGTAGAVKLVDPKDSAAKAVNYVENKTEVKEAHLKAERQGVAFEKQNCKNCGFYSNPKGSGDAEVGSCTIFSGQVVKANAWCSTWNKKA